MSKKNHKQKKQSGKSEDFKREPPTLIRFPPSPLPLRRGSYAKSPETTYGGPKVVPEEATRKWILFERWASEMRAKTAVGQ